MRFFKFTVKYGPGSVGHNARVLAKMFIQLKRAYPTYTKDELFRELLELRMSGLYKSLISKTLTNTEMEKIIREAEGKLSKLIFLLSRWEKPSLRKLGTDNINWLMDVTNTIREIVEKHAPEGDQ